MTLKRPRLTAYSASSNTDVQRRRLYALLTALPDTARSDQFSQAARKLGLTLDTDLITVQQILDYVDQQVAADEASYSDFFDAFRSTGRGTDVTDYVQSAARRVLASAEGSGDSDNADTGDNDSDEAADTMFQHLSMVVDKQALPLVEPALRKLSVKLVKGMKGGGTYDEIVKAVGRVRKDIDKINAAYAEIARYVTKIMEQE